MAPNLATPVFGEVLDSFTDRQFEIILPCASNHVQPVSDEVVVFPTTGSAHPLTEDATLLLCGQDRRLRLQLQIRPRPALEEAVSASTDAQGPHHAPDAVVAEEVIVFTFEQPLVPDPAVFFVPSTSAGVNAGPLGRLFALVLTANGSLFRLVLDLVMVEGAGLRLVPPPAPQGAFQPWVDTVHFVSGPLLGESSVGLRPGVSLLAAVSPSDAVVALACGSLRTAIISECGTKVALHPVDIESFETGLSLKSFFRRFVSPVQEAVPFVAIRIVYHPTLRDVFLFSLSAGGVVQLWSVATQKCLDTHSLLPLVRQSHAHTPQQTQSPVGNLLDQPFSSDSLQIVSILPLTPATASTLTGLGSGDLSDTEESPADAITAEEAADMDSLGSDDEEIFHQQLLVRAMVYISDKSGPFFAELHYRISDDHIERINMPRLPAPTGVQRFTIDTEHVWALARTPDTMLTVGDTPAALSAAGARYESVLLARCPLPMDRESIEQAPSGPLLPGAWEVVSLLPALETGLLTPVLQQFAFFERLAAAGLGFPLDPEVISAVGTRFLATPGLFSMAVVCQAVQMFSQAPLRCADAEVLGLCAGRILTVAGQKARELGTSLESAVLASWRHFLDLLLEAYQRSLTPVAVCSLTDAPVPGGQGPLVVLLRHQALSEIRPLGQVDLFGAFVAAPFPQMAEQLVAQAGGDIGPWAAFARLARAAYGTVLTGTGLLPLWVALDRALCRLSSTGPGAGASDAAPAIGWASVLDALAGAPGGQEAATLLAAEEAPLGPAGISARAIIYDAPFAQIPGSFILTSVVELARSLASVVAAGSVSYSAVLNGVELLLGAIRQEAQQRAWTPNRLARAVASRRFLLTHAALALVLFRRSANTTPTGPEESRTAAAFATIVDLFSAVRLTDFLLLDPARSATHPLVLSGNLFAECRLRALSCLEGIFALLDVAPSAVLQLAGLTTTRSAGILRAVAKAQIQLAIGAGQALTLASRPGRDLVSLILKAAPVPTAGASPEALYAHINHFFDLLNMAHSLELVEHLAQTVLELYLGPTETKSTDSGTGSDFSVPSDVAVAIFHFSVLMQLFTSRLQLGRFTEAFDTLLRLSALRLPHAVLSSEPSSLFSRQAGGGTLIFGPFLDQARHTVRGSALELSCMERFVSTVCEAGQARLLAELPVDSVRAALERTLEHKAHNSPVCIPVALVAELGAACEADLKHGSRLLAGAAEAAPAAEADPTTAGPIEVFSTGVCYHKILSSLYVSNRAHRAAARILYIYASRVLALGAGAQQSRVSPIAARGLLQLVADALAMSASLLSLLPRAEAFFYLRDASIMPRSVGGPAAATGPVTASPLAVGQDAAGSSVLASVRTLAQVQRETAAAQARLSLLLHLTTGTGPASGRLDDPQEAVAACLGGAFALAPGAGLFALPVGPVQGLLRQHIEQSLAGLVAAGHADRAFTLATQSGAGQFGPVFLRLLTRVYLTLLCQPAGSRAPGADEAWKRLTNYLAVLSDAMPEAADATGGGAGTELELYDAVLDEWLAQSRGLPLPGWLVQPYQADERKLGTLVAALGRAGRHAESLQVASQARAGLSRSKRLRTELAASSPSADAGFFYSAPV
ncbi:hypothetical protein H696_03886 [Fonticula alba]|uniref:Uncharacterized protein n=1 Tax=Fonticula alba TaxID=691883 RepID=A0A058Z7I4_FONAL|nr:hypothetical protein H696_03886 [Fonticula alba]KCV69457.1 hypothetical protein H696_03886 [Fonticula alba]|eukprot:XP_009496022.1 hypothetical protein H696_03886 [Fonticula alba]